MNSEAELPKQERGVILILGAGRSGTSSIAKATECLGSDLGSGLLGANPDNPKGFFEKKAILYFNEFLLLAMGRRWYSTSPVNKIQQRLVKAIFGWPARLVLILSFPKQGLYTLKEPRITTLFWFWEHILSKHFSRIYLLCAFRNPLLVASSQSRSHPNLDVDWIELWTRATSMCFQAMKSYPSEAVFFEDFLADPKSSLTRISKSFNLPLDQKKVSDYVDSFLDRNLVHGIRDVYLSEVDNRTATSIEFSNAVQLMNNERLKTLNKEEQ